MLKLVHSKQEPSAMAVATRVFGWIALAFVLVVVPFVAVAQAGATVDPESIESIVKLIAGAVQGHSWVAAAGGASILLVWILRRFAVKIPKVGPFIATSAGGTLFTLVTTALLFLGLGLASGTASWSLAGGALVAGFTAIGGWVGLRRLVPLLAMIPGVGGFFKWLVPEDVGTRVAAEVSAAYTPKPVDATAAAQDLSKPPVA